MGERMERAAEAAAVQAFIEGLSEHEGVEMIEAMDAEAALAEVDSGRADAALVFGSPLRISVAEGKDLYKNRAVTLIAQNIAHEYAAYKAAFLQAPGAFAEISAKGMPDFSGLAVNKDLGASRSMMDFYAVTAIVMIAFMGGGIGGAARMFFGRQSGMLRRVTASPRGRARLFIESVVGVLPQNILQATIVMVVSTVFFGAHYAKTMPENLLLFCFFVLLGMAVTAVFMLVGMFVRVNPYVPLMATLWALLFMSGTFSKDIFIEGFSEYLPMNIAQRAAFDLTVFGRPEQLLVVMGVCAIVLAASCVLGAVFFRRKEIML
jgi:ABC-2 type transport system permease protein